MDNGNLLATASFGASLVEDPAAFVLTTKDGVASVSVAARDEGGRAASVRTIRPGTSTVNEIQELTVRGAGGTFTLTFWNDADADGLVGTGETEDDGPDRVQRAAGRRRVRARGARPHRQRARQRRQLAGGNAVHDRVRRRPRQEGRQGPDRRRGAARQAPRGPGRHRHRGQGRHVQARLPLRHERRRDHRCRRRRHDPAIAHNADAATVAGLLDDLLSGSTSAS